MCVLQSLLANKGFAFIHSLTQSFISCKSSLEQAMCFLIAKTFIVNENYFYCWNCCRGWHKEHLENFCCFFSAVSRVWGISRDSRHTRKLKIDTRGNNNKMLYMIFDKDCRIFDSKHYHPALLLIIQLNQCKKLVNKKKR